MAKGNPFMGQMRGSVGDVTFTRLGGAQVARSRNRAPKNPRSNKQQLQRATFVEPSKFFIRGNQQMFKFAFEDKRGNESDFNAFMRHNSKNGVLMLKEQVSNDSIAKIGKFVLTYGSLASVAAMKIEAMNFADDVYTAGLQLGPKTTETSIQSIGDLSRYLKAAYPTLQYGDIITYLTIMTDNIVSSSQPYLESQEIHKPIWSIAQIQLDTNNPDTLPDNIKVSVSDGVVTLYNPLVEQIGDVFAGAVVISRPTANGLLVSTTELTLSADTLRACQRMAVSDNFDNPWVAAVVASYAATGEAILEGSYIERASDVIADVTSIKANGVELEPLSSFNEAVTLVIEGNNFTSSNVIVYRNGERMSPISSTIGSKQYNFAVNGSYAISVNGTTESTFRIEGIVTPMTITDIEVNGQHYTQGAAQNIRLQNDHTYEVKITGTDLNGSFTTTQGTLSGEVVTSTEASVTLATPMPPMVEGGDAAVVSLGNEVLFTFKW